MKPRTFRLSLFNNTFDNVPKTISRTIDLIGQSLTTPGEPVGKNNLACWSPTFFTEGRTRSKAAAKEITMLVYDMDDGIAPIDSWRCFSRWTVICHSTYSHPPAHHKYRIILPLEKPVPVGDWGRAAAAACLLWEEMVGRGSPDPKAIKDPARMYYRYAVPPAGDYMVGDPMNPWNLHQAHFHRAYHDDGRDLYLELDYSHIEEEKPRAVSRPVPNRKGQYDIGDLMEDFEFRSAVADRMGATIQGNEARFRRWPQCKRDSAHFALDLRMPAVKKSAECNHRESCGWWGNLKALMGEA